MGCQGPQTLGMNSIFGLSFADSRGLVTPNQVDQRRAKGELCRTAKCLTCSIFGEGRQSAKEGSVRSGQDL